MADKFEKRKICEYCESEMEAINRNKKFCSDKCRVYWNREHPKVISFKTVTQGKSSKPTEKPKEDNSQSAPNDELLTKYQNELELLKDKTSQIAKDRRKWLEKQIQKLKS